MTAVPVAVSQPKNAAPHLMPPYRLFSRATTECRSVAAVRAPLSSGRSATRAPSSTVPECDVRDAEWSWGGSELMMTPSECPGRAGSTAPDLPVRLRGKHGSFLQLPARREMSVNMPRCLVYGVNDAPIFRSVKGFGRRPAGYWRLRSHHRNDE